MRLFLLLFVCSTSFFAKAQTDSLPEGSMLDLLGIEESTTEYATAAFKTTRVINLHSIENTAGGVLDVKIQHRFGDVTQGAYTLWGLDQATMRMGLDYGVTNRLQVGLGRNTYEKLFDGFLKYKLLRQSKGVKNMPVTAAIFTSLAYKSVKWSDPELGYKKVHRTYNTFQLILGRKFSDKFSFQASPTLVHRNLVANRNVDHNIFALGLATRFKLTNRTSLNVEYNPILAGNLGAGYQPSWAVGFDIETGGHVFQLQFSNAITMVEKSFLTETARTPGKQAVYFGFNLSRVFTLTQKGRSFD